MNFHARRARDRAQCASQQRDTQGFIADVYEAIAAIRESVQEGESAKDQEIALTAVMQALRHQYNVPRVIAESRCEGWTLHDIDAAAVLGAQWGGKTDD